MSVFFSSDQHFWHVNRRGGGILQYSNRPFKTIEEMNEVIITKWNNKVSKGDTIYCLGDLSFGNREQTLDILSRLRGRIHFTTGDHDKVLHSGKFKFEFYGYRQVLEYKDNKAGIYIYMLHWKMDKWPRKHYNSFHCFGHSHNRSEPSGKSLDVGVDGHNYEPWSLEEVIEYMKNRPDNYVKEATCQNEN